MVIPKTKVLIYALTFLAYAFSGYGSNVLTNLKDAVLTAESLFGDVFQNLITVLKTFRVAHEVLNDATDEICEYQCPSGTRPIPNKYHKPSSNGCGSYDIELHKYLNLGEITDCCNKHDICYDTCNSGKEKCDFDMQRCLYKLCETNTQQDTLLKSCKATAKIVFTGSLALGCKAYRDSQKNACYCLESSRKFKTEL